MFEDRRRHPRYPVLLAGEARPTGGKAFRVVCTSVSRAGAYFACSVEVAPGTELLTTLHTSASSGVELACRVEAVRHNPRGGGESPGFGARWHSLICKQGPDPLWQFVVEMLHFADAPLPEVDPSGLARYDVNSDGVWIGAPVVQPAMQVRAESLSEIREADTLVGGLAALRPGPASAEERVVPWPGADPTSLHDTRRLIADAAALVRTEPAAPAKPPASKPHSALSEVLELEILRTLATKVSVPSTRDSARFTAMGDFWDDDRTVAGPAPAADATAAASSAPTPQPVAPQAPLALFSARRRDPSQPYEPFDGEQPAAPTAAQDRAVTLRELPPFAPTVPKAQIWPVASVEFPVGDVDDIDKTQP